MKKLLIAMTAAAVGFGAWATENAATPIFSDDFSSWQNGEAGYLTSLPTGWTYTKDGATAEFGENELVVANEKLKLNTGSKVLTGTFGQTVIPSDTGLFFSSKVTFKDPSDTLPELGDGDKFALVVLDNTESIDAQYATDPATNLWVVAKYGVNGKRAYKLDTVIDPTWLGDEHTITIKAYNNVMESGTTACAGFLIKVDNLKNDTVSKVLASYVIDENGVITGDYWASGSFLDTDANLGYLGFPKEAIASAVRQRYVDGELLLSNVPSDNTLTSVDFQGQGDIDDVTLAKTGADFGDDATVVTFDGYSSAAIYSITYGGKGVTGGVYTIDGTESVSEEGNVEIVVTLNSGYAIKVGDNAIENTYTFTTALASAAEIISLDVFEIQARVNGTAYGSFAEALTAAAGKTIVLTSDLTLEEAAMINDTITVDLAGKTIKPAANYLPVFFVNGSLTVMDSSINGDGTVDGAIVGSDESVINLTGGKFKDVYGNGGFPLNDAFYEFPGAAEGYQADPIDGYYVVTEKPAAPSTFAVTYTAGNFTLYKLNGETYAEFTTGTALANGDYTFKVAAAQGHDIVSVTVGGNVATLTDGAFSVTVNGAAVVIAVTTREVASIDDEEGNITVDDSGNANITSTNETVTITGTITGDITVQPGVGTVNVTLAEGKTVKIYEGSTNISDAFTVSVDKTAGKVTIALKEDGYVVIEGERINVKPEMAAASGDNMDAPLEVGNTVDVGVKTIPGLMYQLIRSGTPNGTFNGVGDAVKGTGAPVKLSDTNRPSDKAFYKVKVSAR